jgi:superfamily II DNA or RNA helicase
VPRALVQPEHFDAFTYELIDGYSKAPYRVETFEEELDRYGFHRGNLAKLRRCWPDLPFDDHRISNPHGYDLRFTGKLRDEQKRLIREWLSFGYGQIQAPPRFGKTLVCTALMTKLRQRTLMLAHLQDLCEQLEETIRAFTNINDLEAEHGVRLCGVLDEWTDFFPIATLSTYQCFAVSARGRRVLREHAQDFGLVMVDEVHRCKTQLFTEVVTTCNAAYRCGVTATPTRKDGLHCVVNDVIGPVVCSSDGEQLPVVWSWEYTERSVKNFSNWSVMWNRLSKDPVRNRRIARKVVEDVRAGHYCLVTTERLQHIDDLKAAIHAIDPDITIGELSGKTKKRKSFRDSAKCGDYQVVIAMNKIVELGYNVPRWSCFHNTLPMTDPNNWYQRVSRIRTPWEPAFDGDDHVKPQPIARVWVDTGHPAVYAYKAVVRRVMDRLNFTCTNKERDKPKRGRRRGLVSREEIPDEREDQAGDGAEESRSQADAGR